MIRHAVSVVILLLAACGTGIGDAPSALITDIVVDGAATGPAECRDFRLEEQEIRFFWTNAIEITPQIWHQTYDVLPCDLSGTFVRGGSPVAWQINAGGSGKLTLPDGQARLFGCEACRDRY